MFRRITRKQLERKAAQVSEHCGCQLAIRYLLTADLENVAVPGRSSFVSLVLLIFNRGYSVGIKRTAKRLPNPVLRIDSSGMHFDPYYTQADTFSAHATWCWLDAFGKGFDYAKQGELKLDIQLNPKTLKAFSQDLRIAI